MGCGTSSPKLEAATETTADAGGPVPASDAKEPAAAAEGGSAQERALRQLQLIFESVDAFEDSRVSKAVLSAALGKELSLEDLIAEAGFNLKYRVLDEVGASQDGAVSLPDFLAHARGDSMHEAKTDIASTAPGDVVRQEATTELEPDARESWPTLHPGSERVLKMLKHIFGSMDGDHDGAVRTGELAKRIRANIDGAGATKEESLGQCTLDQLGCINHFLVDTNHDGLLTWEEVEASFRKVASEGPQSSPAASPACVEAPASPTSGTCGCL